MGRCKTIYVFFNTGFSWRVNSSIAAFTSPLFSPDEVKIHFFWTELACKYMALLWTPYLLSKSLPWMYSERTDRGRGHFRLWREEMFADGNMWQERHLHRWWVRSHWKKDMLFYFIFKFLYDSGSIVNDDHHMYVTNRSWGLHIAWVIWQLTLNRTHNASASGLHRISRQSLSSISKTNWVISSRWTSTFRRTVVEFISCTVTYRKSTDRQPFTQPLEKATYIHLKMRIFILQKMNVYSLL